MMDEIFAADCSGIESFIGKPVVIWKDGKKRVIGEVTDARVEDEGLVFEAKITDPEMRKLLEHP